MNVIWLCSSSQGRLCHPSQIWIIIHHSYLVCTSFRRTLLQTTFFLTSNVYPIFCLCFNLHGNYPSSALMYNMTLVLVVIKQMLISPTCRWLCLFEVPKNTSDILVVIETWLIRSNMKVVWKIEKVALTYWRDTDFICATQYYSFIHSIDSVKANSPYLELVLPLSISSILSFPGGHLVASYVFFLVFPSLLYFSLPFF